MAVAAAATAGISRSMLPTAAGATRTYAVYGHPWERGGFSIGSRCRDLAGGGGGAFGENHHEPDQDQSILICAPEPMSAVEPPAAQNGGSLGVRRG